MKNKNYSNIVLIPLGLSLVSYTFYKAINSSFTHDESFTYSNYVNISISDIINYTNCPIIPNNHIFNTLLMKLSQSFLGNSEFALRLPNLLIHILYIVFSILWLKKFKNATLLISGFIVLNVNVYLLDFFSIARGYGLSSGLMFISFYYCYEYFKTLKSKYNWLSFFFAVFAVWSNFTVLNYYVSLLGVFFIFLIVRMFVEEKSVGRKIKLFIFESLPVILISFILYKLISKPLETIQGTLFGPEDGFYHDTIRSLVFSTERFYNENLVTVICLFVFLVLIVSLLYYTYDYVKKRFNILQSPHLLVLLILFLAAFSTIAQHYLYKTQFLQDRTALFYIVLFNICFVYLYYNLLQKSKNTRVLHIGFAVYPVFLLVIFICHFNPYYYFDWKYDRNTKKMLTELQNDFESSPIKSTKINLGITWLFEPAIKYYRDTKNLNWLNPVNRGGYDKGSFDYYYIWNDKDFITKNKKTIVKQYDTSDSILAKN
ncbi:MAG: hypothetical protein ABI723_03940 [Bacteroidia bacterium]